MIEEANDALRAKGYSEAQLVVAASPLPGKALLKGNRIVSPFSDTPETIARVAEGAVPSLADLGNRRLTPHELRDWLSSEG